MPTSTEAGSEMIAIRPTICCCSVLASGELTPTTSLIPNNVDGSVPASVIILVRSSGSGSSPPRLTSSFCMNIWPRAPTARLRPWASARIFSSLTLTDPVIASSAVSSIGAYIVTVSTNPTLFDATRSRSTGPPFSSVVTPERTSGSTLVLDILR